jgi:hypothetical protein
MELQVIYSKIFMPYKTLISCVQKYKQPFFMNPGLDNISYDPPELSSLLKNYNS